MSTKITGTLSGVGNGTPAQMECGKVHGDIWGAFVATMNLERSIDGGTTWIPVNYFKTATPVVLTAPASVCTNKEPERTAQYRWRCSAYTSGTINYRLGQ